MDEHVPAENNVCDLSSDHPMLTESLGLMEIYLRQVGCL